MVISSSTTVPIDELKRKKNSIANCCYMLDIYDTTHFPYSELLLLPTSPNLYCAQLILPSLNVQSLFA